MPAASDAPEGRLLRRILRPAVPVASIAVALWVTASSCGGGEDPAAPPRVATTVARLAGDDQSAAAGDDVAIDPVVEVRDAAGLPMAGATVRFTPDGGAALSDTVVTTGTDGRATVDWLLGSSATAYTLTATAGTASTTFSATATTPVPGAAYFGRNDYIEYIAGDLPLIITAPHGGTEIPAELPDRTGAITTVRDGNTTELARTIGDVFLARTGGRPHLILMRLRRTKIDANREIVEAAQGHPLTERAWIDYHSFIEAAKSAVVARSGTGLYLDLHGHGHEIQRLELGYLVSRTRLGLSDAALDQPSYESESSIRTLSQASPASFPELLRGSISLGALFEAQGFPAVPSPASPNPGIADYFDGGYNTARHGSRGGGPISGVQIEANYTGVRDTQANRERFAHALVTVWQSFVAGTGAQRAPLAGR